MTLGDVNVTHIKSAPVKVLVCDIKSYFLSINVLLHQTYEAYNMYLVYAYTVFCGLIDYQTAFPDNQS